MKYILLLAVVLYVSEASEYYGSNVGEDKIGTLERFKKLLLTSEIQEKDTLREVIRQLIRSFGSEDGASRATVSTPPTTTTVSTPLPQTYQATLTAAPETDPPTTTPTPTTSTTSTSTTTTPTPTTSTTSTSTTSTTTTMPPSTTTTTTSPTETTTCWKSAKRPKRPKRPHGLSKGQLKKLMLYKLYKCIMNLQNTLG